MKRGFAAFAFCGVLLLGAGAAQASGLNGTSVWGTGGVSAQMGGTGTARPLDSTSSVLRNPAGLSLQERPIANLDFTWLRTDTNGDYEYPAALGGPWEGQSNERNYPLFATAIAYPLSQTSQLKGIPLSIGAGLDVSAGAGTDWVASPLGLKSLYLVFSGAVCASYKIGNLSIGAGPRVNFGLVDLGFGHHLDSDVGAQAGVIYSLEPWTFGASYISSIALEFPRACDIDFDGVMDNLTIEEPHQVYFGISYKGFEKWVFNAEGRWLNYGGADFYKDIDWKDVWGGSFGVQYALFPWLNVRAGYLYNTNPVEEHDGFDFGGFRDIQGHQMPNAVYEVMHLTCLPLFCMHHVGGGVGITIVDGLMINLGATYDFENTNEYKDSTGTFSVKQDLSIITFDVGLQFTF
ncbi:MAG: hypothetical protein AB1640_18560 [bacterium]